MKEDTMSWHQLPASFQKIPESLNVENMLYIMPEIMPSVTMEERDATVFSIHHPSQHDKSLWEYSFFLDKHEAFRSLHRKKLASAQDDGVAISPHAKRTMLNYGVQQHRMTLPVYTVHYFHNDTTPHQKQSVSPDQTDQRFRTLVNEYIQSEKRIARRLGYASPEELMQDSPVALLIQHYGYPAIRSLEKRYAQHRTQMWHQLEDTMRDDTRTMRFDVGQQLHFDAQLLMNREMTTALYDWFDPAQHADYPLDWLVEMHIDIEAVVESLAANISCWWLAVLREFQDLGRVEVRVLPNS